MDVTVLPNTTSTTYNVLSHKNVSVNTRFDQVDYHQAGPRAQLVHGAYIRGVYTKIMTNASSLVHVEYNANHSLRGIVTVDGKVDLVGGTKPKVKVDNVEVSLVGRTLTVSTPEWTINAISKVKKTIIDAPTCALGKCFLELGIKAAFDADHAIVAPHGLIGQTWDGDDIGFIGKQDEYKGNEVTTTALGEGAIEGVAANYQVASKFSTDFKYSRWGKVAAAPRDVSTLTGLKVKRAGAAGAAGAVEDDA
jgi:hypothetical protein